MHTFVDPAMPEYDGEGDPRPAAPEALRLAETMIELDKAAAELERARSRVGEYTGQYDAKHFIRYEQDVYNRAAEAFADAVVAVVNKANEANA
jgi:precorrin isomerase